MSRHQIGDLIEAVHPQGKQRVRGYVVIANDGVDSIDFLPHQEPTSLAFLAARGWEIATIERVPVPLPTEPGHYLDKDGGVWLVDEHGYLAIQVKGASGWFTADHLHKYAPFTRLRPEAETAKAVLEAIKDRYDENFYSNAYDPWNDVARQYGVTS